MVPVIRHYLLNRSTGARIGPFKGWYDCTVYLSYLSCDGTDVSSLQAIEIEEGEEVEE